MTDTTSETPHYPDVTVQLSGEDGSAFAIMGRVDRALRLAGAPPKDLSAYHMEATAGDYDNLLRVTMRWVTVL